MKNGKNPTVAQKKRIAEFKLNSENWLVIKDSPKEFLIQNRNSGNTRSFKKIINVV